MDGRTVLFFVALAAHLALLAGTLLALLVPGLRIWPPPGRHSWQFRLTWVLFLVAAPAGVALGIADWDSLGLAAWVRYAAGLPLVGLGLGLAAWGMRTLSVAQTAGLEGTLIATGPYEFSRNPQYIGDIAATAGWAVLSGSLLMSVVALPAIAWYVLLPFTEEPWLRTRYGEAYERYARRVRRFF